MVNHTKKEKMGVRELNKNEQSLTDIMFEVVVAMLNGDPELYKRVRTVMKEDVRQP